MLRGSCSRRAAEEDEHVVVWGEQGGNMIESTRVCTGERLHADMSTSACPPPEHHGDPPDGFDFEGDVVMDIEDNHEATAEKADGSSAPFVVWNCQGAGGKVFHRVLKTLVQTHKPAILGLVEPKVSGSHANAICTRLVFRIGFGSRRWVLARVGVDPHDYWFFTVVYGSPTHHLRRRLWSELQMTKRGLSGLMLIAGDFNSVVNQNETSNYSAFSLQRSSDFADWINSEGFIDMGFHGPKLTWVRSDQSGFTKGARLDRALCNARDVRYNRAPFRFQAAWLTDQCLKDVIHNAWRPSSGFTDNISVITDALLDWNKHVFGNIVHRKKVVLARLNGRSREDWIVFGDRNTKYYHIATTIRKSRNTISSLRDVDGEWITDDDLLKAHVQTFYVTLFSDYSAEQRDTSLEGVFPVLSQDEWRVFNQDISKEEVCNALFDMSPFKAPGPDGCLPDGLNDTLLALIPKVGTPKTIRQFRPISLCNISDNILVYQEVMHTMRTKRGSTGIMAIKLDFEKAYDRLSWQFVDTILKEIGFSSMWVKVIMCCIRTARLSVNWNGNRLSQFHPERGLRQGDPMSPAIFVLGLEKLCQIITLRVNSGDWKGVQLAPGCPILSHLCFADDMVLFAEASIDQIAVIQDCLSRFCAASGQRISYEKS
ncbi:uncharacterized protein LOC116033348 [Ipomoea triloba]|uniref:uncharacterized protein LOC116033348 n=1 Tax=Ipomoea triloba TaxID=35885 RepID=UPI00125DFA0E|nr:uncharacterized protein LOC116033348 [Ipomoea triloba]